MTEPLTLSFRSLRFETERLMVSNWRGVLARPEGRGLLISDLEPLLRPEILRDLPPSMQLSGTGEAISAWIDDRLVESECYIVRLRSDGRAIGLLILAGMSDASPVTTLHLGYLLRQDAWGQGFATELVAGLVTALTPGAPLKLMGGVAKTNPASAQVLRKLGFKANPEIAPHDTAIYSLSLEPHPS